MKQLCLGFFSSFSAGIAKEGSLVLHLSGMTDTLRDAGDENGNAPRAIQYSKLC